MELSQVQKDIVFAQNTAIYLKTDRADEKIKLLIERIRHLFSQTRKQILILTFTHKAREEIKKYVHDIPESEEKIFVGTFCDFCKSVLKSYRHLIGLKEMPHTYERKKDKMVFIYQSHPANTVSS